MDSMPKTLLQIAGAPLHASPLDRAALVVIDHQLEYKTGGIPLAGIDAAVAETAKLLDLARKHKMPVFHIQHRGKPGGPAFDPEGPYWPFIPAVAPKDGETVVPKSLPNAFAGTQLHELIQATGRKELILAGFATHICVAATARGAIELGYRATVVADATAARDLPHPTGKGVMPAKTVHEGALAAMADRFAVVVPDTAALIARQPANA